MVPEGERAVVVLEAEEGVARALGDQLPVQAEVHVVAGVDGVFVVSELEGEQRVLAPRHVGVHLDLGAFLVQVGVPLAAQGAEVDLEEDIGAGYQHVLGCVIQSDNPNRMEICSTKRKLHRMWHLTCGRAARWMVQSSASVGTLAVQMSLSPAAPRK